LNRVVSPSPRSDLRSLIVATALCLLSASTGCTRKPAATTPPAPLPTVIVVSFDALGDRFLDRDTLPNFGRMMTEGVRAPFRPEFPSKTFPNHYSMASGLTPGQHGITINQFFDPVRGEWFRRASASDGSFFSGEPIWVTAERAGIHTAVYFWTGSEAEIGGRRPTFWYPFDATVPDSIKIAQIVQWLRLPEAQRPHLIMMYSPVVDMPGHKRGPDARETYAGVRTADKTLGALRDSLKQFASLGVDVIVVSDHGLVAVPREHDIDMDSLIPPRGALVDDEHATFSIWADPASPGLNLDSIAAVYRRIIPHTRVFRPGQFPPEWQTEQNRRFGDVFLLADPGWEFVGTNPSAVYTLGEHGYDPNTPEMMGIFLATGPDFQSGVRLDARENRTLRDLLAHLLHLPVARTTTVRDFGLVAGR
jgi:predicted AlkP superfamily pyrophosphatase or phosphodiesterase